MRLVVHTSAFTAHRSVIPTNQSFPSITALWAVKALVWTTSLVRDPVGLVVHTSAFTAHRSVIQGKLWFVGNFNSNIGKREHSWVWGWDMRHPCH